MLYLHEQTRLVMMVAFVAAALNIGLNLLLIPHWGILGAAVATCVSYATQLAAIILAVGRYHRVTIPTRPLLQILLATGSVYGVFRLSALGSLGWTIGGAVGGSLLYAIVLFSSREIRAAVVRFTRRGDEKRGENPSIPFVD